MDLCAIGFNCLQPICLVSEQACVLNNAGCVAASWMCTVGCSVSETVIDLLEL